jgi:glycogen synthase kinase 3 beta
MVHPFFDELRDPNTRLPDSRHPNAPSRELPKLFDFTHHGMLDIPSVKPAVIHVTSLTLQQSFPSRHI